MLGRAPYQNPWLLAGVDQQLFAEPAPLESRGQVIEALLPYVERQLATGARLNHMTRHILGLYQGQRGGKRFRRHLSEQAHRDGAGVDTLLYAASLCDPTVNAANPQTPETIASV
jgi:tRNA-dihydrouridine synthase A